MATNPKIPVSGRGGSLALAGCCLRSQLLVFDLSL